MAKPAQHEIVNRDERMRNANGQLLSPNLSRPSAAASSLSNNAAFSSAAQTAKSALMRLTDATLNEDKEALELMPHLLGCKLLEQIEPIIALIDAAATKDQASEIPQELVAKAQQALEPFRGTQGGAADFKTVEAFILSTKVQ